MCSSKGISSCSSPASRARCCCARLDRNFASSGNSGRHQTRPLGAGPERPHQDTKKPREPAGVKVNALHCWCPGILVAIHNPHGCQNRRDGGIHVPTGSLTARRPSQPQFLGIAEFTPSPPPLSPKGARGEWNSKSNLYINAPLAPLGERGGGEGVKTMMIDLIEPNRRSARFRRHPPAGGWRAGIKTAKIVIPKHPHECIVRAATKWKSRVKSKCQAKQCAFLDGLSVVPPNPAADVPLRGSV